MSIGNTVTTSSGTSNNTFSTTTANLYTHPQMLDVIINQTTIEIVYKRQLMISNGFGMPQPEVYKVVYSRLDGSEKTIFGSYVPACNESYYF
jgi:hypothetical protein